MFLWNHVGFPEKVLGGLIILFKILDASIFQQIDYNRSLPCFKRKKLKTEGKIDHAHQTKLHFFWGRVEISKNYFERFWFAQLIILSVTEIRF